MFCAVVSKHHHQHEEGECWIYHRRMIIKRNLSLMSKHLGVKSLTNSQEHADYLQECWVCCELAAGMHGCPKLLAKGLAFLQQVF